MSFALHIGGYATAEITPKVMSDQRIDLPNPIFACKRAKISDYAKSTKLSSDFRQNDKLIFWALL